MGGVGGGWKEGERTGEESKEEHALVSTSECVGVSFQSSSHLSPVCGKSGESFPLVCGVCGVCARVGSRTVYLPPPPSLKKLSLNPILTYGLSVANGSPMIIPASICAWIISLDSVPVKNPSLMDDASKPSRSPSAAEHTRFRYSSVKSIGYLGKARE